MIIGLDVGGTNTDVVLLGDKGVLKVFKIATDPNDFFNTVLKSLQQILKGIKPEEITRIVLSTTLATNAIVQNKIPHVGMIVAGGPGIDPFFFKTNPYYFSVSGSIDHRGREIEAINYGEIEKIARELEIKKIKHVGVVGKFSVRNPLHEIQIRDILKKSFEKVFLGHEISGNLNFPRRIATTYLNTAVYPIHEIFFNNVTKSLAEKGIKAPIHILKSDSGTMSFEASLDSPSQTIISGPAASVMGAMAFAKDDDEILVLDIGGTTTDISLLIGRVPVMSPLGIEIGGHKTLLKSIMTRSIGIGGDSVVKVFDKKLEIGPERNGDAMAFGGLVPTPTDAIVVLNKLKHGCYNSSYKGIASVAKKIDISVEDAAYKIFDLAGKKIFKEASDMIDIINSKPVYTIHEIKKNYKISPKKIMILGGPAPYFSKHFEKLFKMPVSIVPRWNVANAVGAALSRTTCEVTLFADTKQKIACAPEEQFTKKITSHFTKKEALKIAIKLLKEKAIKVGAETNDLKTDVIENLQFNMVRNFRTIGKNIRIKVQVTPGLINGYDYLVK